MAQTTSAQESVRVMARFRPLLAREGGQTPQDVRLTSTQVVVDGHHFNFDRVMNPLSTQEECFETVAKPTVNWSLEGYNATIFAYGQTGTGKSFSMFGNQANPGIVPRSCEMIFDELEIRMADDAISPRLASYEIGVSFIEVYMENIRDLLNPYAERERKSLLIREGLINQVSGRRDVYIQHLTERTVSTLPEVMELIESGMSYRATTSTAMNDTSSRSHAILLIKISQTYDNGTVRLSKLNLVDLAGSENVGKSQVVGIKLAEAQMINKSLLALKCVVASLTNQARTHTPYRDSKLTYLLQDSLGGNSRTVLLVTASTDSGSITETVNTMRFATQSKFIRNRPTLNILENKNQTDDTIRALQARLEEMTRKFEESKQVIDAIQKDDTPPVQEPISLSDYETVLRKMIVFRSLLDVTERKLCKMEARVKCEEDRNAQLESLYDRQRELSRQTAARLYDSQIQALEYRLNLQQYRILCESLKSNAATPEVLALLVDSSGLIADAVDSIQDTAPETPEDSTDLQ